MKISVIMIAHNREHMVRNMIQDILGQTWRNFEYIIVDNASKDGSGRIIDTYARLDGRIRLVHLTEEVSIGKARNIGLRCSAGDFVTYVDDDDRVEKDFLNLLGTAAENMDFVMCGTTEMREGKVYLQCAFEGKYQVNAKLAVEKLLKREHIRAGMPAKLFRREILLKYPFQEDCVHEDIHTTYKYMSEIRHGVVMGTPKYCCVRHGDNVSYFTTDFSALQPEQLDEYLAAYKEREQFISDKLPELTGLAQYSTWSFMLSICRNIVENEIKSCRQQYDEMRRYLLCHEKEICLSAYTTESERAWLERMKNSYEENSHIWDRESRKENNFAMEPE